MYTVTLPALREKFGVKDEWVLPFELIPIINIPEFGDKAAEKTCIDLKIKSQNDKEKLAEAKRLTYLKVFLFEYPISPCPLLVFPSGASVNVTHVFLVMLVCPVLILSWDCIVC